MKHKISYLEEAFERAILRFSIPQPVREFKFYCWRFDYAWVAHKVFVEIDGGTFNGGDHVRGRGYQRDCKKNNKAQIEGWAVLRADREMVSTFEFAQDVKSMLLVRAKQCQLMKTDRRR